MSNQGERLKKVGKQKSKTKLVNGRGRPKLPDGEKGNYEFVLLPRSVIKKVDLLTEKNSTLAAEVLYSYVDAIEEADEVREYYWKLIFSYAVYQAIHNLKKRNIIEDENIGITKIADLLKVNSFNLRRLFLGKGQAPFFIKLIDSLYRYEVNILEIKYKPGIVLIAYAKYIQLISSD